jgi:hypothetical protein
VSADYLGLTKGGIQCQNRCPRPAPSPGAPGAQAAANDDDLGVPSLPPADVAIDQGSQLSASRACWNCLKAPF